MSSLLLPGLTTKRRTEDFVERAPAHHDGVNSVHEFRVAVVNFWILELDQPIDVIVFSCNKAVKTCAYVYRSCHFFSCIYEMIKQSRESKRARTRCAIYNAD